MKTEKEILEEIEKLDADLNITEKSLDAGDDEDIWNSKVIEMRVMAGRIKILEWVLDI